MTVFKCKDAIEFFDKHFDLSKDFREDLRSSQRPNIIIIVGPARSGKSTLANIIFKPKLYQKNEIFKTDEGNVPVTIKIQYCKIKMSQLLQIHKIKMNVDFESDIFILDCEGIDSLGEVTVSLRKAIISLLQISSVNIFVTKNIDRSNIFDLKSFFSLPQLIPGSQQKLNKVCAITLTDIGVPGKPSEEDFEAKRKENDANELTKFLLHLKDRHINFTKENTAFFAQPKWKNENHYFESIKDIIRFSISGISKRIPIPGQNIVEIFDKIVPVISKINELDDPDVKLEMIVKNLIQSYFQTSYDISIQQLPILIQEIITNKTAQQLISMADQKYYKAIQNTIILIFVQEANLIYENITNLFPEIYQQFVKNIKNVIQKQSKKEYENRCKQIVIPFIFDQVVISMKTKIKKFFDQQDSEALRKINQQQLITKYQTETTDYYYQQISSVYPKLTSKQEFISKLKQLQIIIPNEVISNKNRRFLECPPFPKNLEEARKSGQTGSQVIIWPNGSPDKHATFSVINNKLAIPGLKAYFYDRETKDGMSWVMYENVIQLAVEIDINSMTIKPRKTSLIYSERSYRNGIFGRRHRRYHTQRITVTLQNPFCFANGKKSYSISSPTQRTVTPIPFFINNMLPQAKNVKRQEKNVKLQPKNVKRQATKENYRFHLNKGLLNF